jgi:K+/H+ antiporter YhaU regulatory subunit KhtT
MAAKTDITLDLIERFRTEIVDMAKKRKQDFPISQRPGNSQYKKIASQEELLEQVASALERARVINMDFLAMAEMVVNKMDQFKIGQRDVLMPIQKKELEWIKEQMIKIKDIEDYKL